LRFRQGQAWDAERVQGQYVDDYHSYASIAIGIYLAASGLTLEEGLSIVDTYARFNSTSRGPFDEVYTYSAKDDVANIKRGYELYNAGRISTGR
jgi:hypothetical protein